MLSEALSFPRTRSDWLTTVLIGGVLSILSFLIIPGILINGYLLRVTRAAVAGDTTAPVFEDWADLFVDGLLVWVIELVYVGVPTFLLVLVVVPVFVVTGSVAGSGMAPRTGLAVGGLVAGLVLLVALLLLVVAGYLVPAALANFARTGEFAAAFDLRTVARAAFTGDYLVAILLVIAVSIVLGFVGAMLSVILVGIFVLFYVQLVVYHLIGQGFARGLGETATGA